MSPPHPLIVVADVDGAPVRIGETVRVASALSDSSVDAHFLGRTGIVVALVFDDPRAQYPGDPLIQVRVEELGEDLFFPEELELLPGWARRRLAELRQVERQGLNYQSS